MNRSRVCDRSFLVVGLVSGLRLIFCLCAHRMLLGGRECMARYVEVRFYSKKYLFCRGYKVDMGRNVHLP
jgi:hypothetical protein